MIENDINFNCAQADCLPKLSFCETDKQQKELIHFKMLEFE